MSDARLLADIKALVAEGDVFRFIKHHMAEAQQAAAHRRALVLKHPDLAKQLTGPLIGFSRPEAWNGYIPPATTCTGAINTAACRPALLALVAEAEARANAQKENAA